VANAWTREARLRLSAYRPDRFPAAHDERVAQGIAAGGISVAASAPGGGQAQTLLEARSALDAGQYETAQILARQVLAENERSVPALLLLARTNYLIGKHDLAAAIVGMAQGIDEQNGEAQLLLGLLALARGRDNPDGARIAATAAFRRATELDPNLGLAWHNLAAQYLQAKNYEQALPAAQRAAALLSSASPVQLNLGSALRGVGRHAEAADVYRRISERDPQYTEPYFNLGVLLLDAPSVPGFDSVSQRRAALQYFLRYQDLTQGRRDESLDALIKEARTAVEREERRQQRKAAGGRP
jgi:tetratricopeptide (TPR) repeat protein